MKSKIKEYIIFLLILIIPTAYFLLRGNQFFWYWIIGSFAVFCLLNTKIDFTKFSKLFFISLSVLYLTFSFFNLRSYKYDGLRLYLRNTILLSQDLNIVYYDRPLYPFFSELILGLILRFTSMSFVNLAFGIAGILTLYTTYLIFNKIFKTKYITRMALFIFATSPTFLDFSISQFKVEPFLIVITNSAILALLKYNESKNPIYIHITSLCCSLAILIKLSALPLVLIILIYTFILAYVKDISSKELIYATFIFTLPLILWTSFYGLRLNSLGYIKPLYTRTHSTTIKLEQNKEVQTQCFKDQKLLENKEYFPLNIYQPINYFKGNLYNTLRDGISNPGMFLYVSILLYPLLSLLFWRQNSWELFNEEYMKTIKFLNIFINISIFLFMIFIKHYYWYLYIIFPFVSAVIPIAIYTNVKTKILKQILESTIIIAGFISTVYCLSDNYKYFNHNGSKKFGYYKEVYDMNKFLESNIEDKYILDASENPYKQHFTFLKYNDKKVIPSNYYFAASQKNETEKYNELKHQNFKYIVVRENTLNDAWYKKSECLNQNTVNLSHFLNNYTNPVYSEDINEIYELK